MPITDVLREAQSEHEILFLLTAYIEAVRFSDSLQLLPEPVRALPLDGARDVGERVARIRLLLDAPEPRDEGTRLVLVEALGLFTLACHRLGTLRASRPDPLLEAA